ncbi:ABC transporter ATP-binding protein [Myxococcota bacterium]|nr:ABC transporter ATP-binding protein [Myxococcota bacterium]
MSAGPAADPALELRGVEVALGRRRVLRGLDLALREEEVVLLAGSNGAGKTTALRVASRSIEVTRGEVELGGRPLAAYSRAELARALAVVPQETSLAFAFRVEEVVLMGRTPHLGTFGFESQRDVEIAHRAMRTVGIEALAQRPMNQLSGGERQLALVARALAQEPRVLLLDEPTAHLDLRHRVALLSVVRAFADAGGCVLMVSHDLTLAARHSDRVVLLAEGRVAAEGPAVQVLVPEHLRAVFGVDAEVVEDAGGMPIVLPRRSASPRSGV